MSEIKVGTKVLPGKEIYGSEFKIHAIRLYRAHGNMEKVRRLLQAEINKGKWPYESVPAHTTILKWNVRLEPGVEEKDIDPAMQEDLNSLAMVKLLQMKIKKGLSSLQFRSIPEVLMAMKYCRELRKELEEKYKDRLREVHVASLLEQKEQALSMKEKIARVKKTDKNIDQSVRSGVLSFINHQRRISGDE